MQIVLQSYIGVIVGGICIAFTAAFIAYQRRSLKAVCSIDNLLRLGAIALLGLAVSEPEILRPLERARATLLLDISDSMDEVVGDKLLAQARKFSSESFSVDVQPFAKNIAPGTVPIEEVNSLRSARTSWGRLDVGGTNLEAALRSTLNREGESILLITDGNENQGNIETAMKAAAARGHKFFPITLPQGQITTSEFKISNLHVPLVAPAKKSVDIRTSIMNRSNKPQRGTLEVKQDETVLLREQVVLAPGEERLVTVQSDPNLGGMREIKATLLPDNREIQSSIERRYLSTQEREKVLLLSGSAEDERYFKRVLSEQAYQLTTVVAGDSGTKDLALKNFSAVILNNISKDELPAQILSGMDSYIQNGGGFLMIGGNKSFGLGGYINSSIEPLLPVELVPPQTVKKRLNVAVALVMDKSGSMSQGQRLDYAKEAAIEVIDNLKDDDLASVVGFDDAPFVVIKLAPVADLRAIAADRVRRLYPAGRTNMLPALDEGRRGLQRAEAGRKHMIVLTDGRLPDEGPFYIELIRQMRLTGITVSTVLLGDADLGFLRKLAEAGGGGYYETNDARNLPRIFLEDIRVSTGERTMKESQQFAVRKGTSEIVSTAIRSFPELSGYVQTKPRAKANLELVAWADNKAEPLLASWNVGRGAVTAYTSDVSGRWSDRWVDWPRFQEFWSNLIDSVRPKDGDLEQAPRFDLRPVVEGGELRLDLALFSDRSLGDVVATVVTPAGEERALQFVQIAKGLFRAIDKHPLAGRYEFRGSVSNLKLTPVAFYLPGDLFAERKNQPPNNKLLERLALMSGGAINPTVDGIRANLSKTSERTPIAHLIALMALLLVILSVLFREVPKFKRWRFLPLPKTALARSQLKN